jgi:hypothetical protein
MLILLLGRPSRDALAGLPARFHPRLKGLYTKWEEDVEFCGLTVGDALAPASGESTGVSSPRGSGVEHFLGKEGVTGSNPVVGSMNLRSPEDGLKLDNNTSS